MTERIKLLSSEPCDAVSVGQQSLNLYWGELGRIEYPLGIGVILDPTGKEYPFTFDAIEGYAGETAASLADNHVIPGQLVKFAKDGPKVLVIKLYTGSPPAASSSANTTYSRPS